MPLDRWPLSTVVRIPKPRDAETFTPPVVIVTSWYLPRNFTPRYLIMRECVAARHHRPVPVPQGVSPHARRCARPGQRVRIRFVQHQHRGAEFCEEMLQGQNLPPVPERGLAPTAPDFDSDPAPLRLPASTVRRLRKSAWWFRPTRGLTNTAGSAAVRIEQASSGGAIEHFDIVVEHPAMRGSAVAQLPVSDSVM